VFWREGGVLGEQARGEREKNRRRKKEKRREREIRRLGCGSEN